MEQQYQERFRPSSPPCQQESSANMSSSSTSQSSRSSKRKGTRSVSTLTPVQLARKRANDREAQRAIRARTKEHIERLEQELDKLRGQHARDHTVQELLRRNRALEEELTQLKESMGLSLTPSPYSSTGTPSTAASNLGAPQQGSPMTSEVGVYEDHSIASGRGTEYGGLSPADYAPPYVPMASDHWTRGPGVHSVSNLSSPSSMANTDEFAAAYIPTSMPNPMLNPGTVGQREVKMEFEDDASSHEAGFPRLNGMSPINDAMTPSSPASSLMDGSGNLPSQLVQTRALPLSTPGSPFNSLPMYQHNGPGSHLFYSMHMEASPVY